MIRPYKSWWWRRQGLNGNGALNPSTLNPSEHYNETTWFGADPDWRDIAEGANRAFNNGGSALSSITQNGLECWEQGTTGSLWSTSTLKAGDSWLEADDYITMYFVIRWDGGLTDYVLDWLGATTNQRFMVAMTTGNRAFFKTTDESANDLQLYPVTALSTGWQVWALRIQNLTNDAKATWINKQDAPLSVSQGTWVKMGLENYTATNRLFSNSALTQWWDGAIAELIIFRDNHSNDTMIRVNQFLQNKWDIA